MAQLFQSIGNIVISGVLPSLSYTQSIHQLAGMHVDEPSTARPSPAFRDGLRLGGHSGEVNLVLTDGLLSLRSNTKTLISMGLSEIDSIRQRSIWMIPGWVTLVWGGLAFFALRVLTLRPAIPVAMVAGIGVLAWITMRRPSLLIDTNRGERLTLHGSEADLTWTSLVLLRMQGGNDMKRAIEEVDAILSPPEPINESTTNPSHVEPAPLLDTIDVSNIGETIGQGVAATALSDEEESRRDVPLGPMSDGAGLRALRALQTSTPAKSVSSETLGDENDGDFGVLGPWFDTDFDATLFDVPIPEPSRALDDSRQNLASPSQSSTSTEATMTGVLEATMIQENHEVQDSVSQDVPAPVLGLVRSARKFRSKNTAEEDEVASTIEVEEQEVNNALHPALVDRPNLAAMIGRFNGEQRYRRIGNSRSRDSSEMLSIASRSLDHVLQRMDRGARFVPESYAEVYQDSGGHPLDVEPESQFTSSQLMRLRANQDAAMSDAGSFQRLVSSVSDASAKEQTLALEKTSRATSKGLRTFGEEPVKAEAKKGVLGLRRIG